MEPTPEGSWRVTLEVSARKVTVDSTGAEQVVPMHDLVEVGVYGEKKDRVTGEPLYLRLHRIRSGDARITVTVPKKPAQAGIDPRNLLVDVVPKDNVRDVTPAAGPPRRGGAP
jgi:hypothetical protein